MNLDPKTLLIFLDLNIELRKTLNLFHPAEIGFELRFTLVVKRTLDNRLRNTTKTPPKDCHHHTHDDVIQRQLENNEHHIKQPK